MSGGEPKVGYYSSAYSLTIPSYYADFGCRTYPEVKEIKCPNLGGISLPFIRGTYRCPQSN